MPAATHVGVMGQRSAAERPVPAVRAGTAGVPWYIWTGAAAVTSSTIGGAWDVSWHRTIGRDTFWTPAHMMIYLCGVLAGIVGLYLVLRCTFGSDTEMRAESVSVLGLRAPLGVFLAGWGGVAMLTSAPFDNWHTADTSPAASAATPSPAHPSPPLAAGAGERPHPLHHNGFPETVTASITIPPGLTGAPLGSDDAAAAPPAVSRGELGPSYRLPDGYRMVWDRPAVIKANQGYSFRFRLLDSTGRPAGDVVPYMGMAGHAAWVKTDGSVFAHTHPEGSAAMPAMMLAEGGSGAMPGMMSEMPGMSGTGAGKQMPIAPVVEFPYGFPSPGRYRVFIQIKHGGTVETGVFDTDVE